MSDRRRVLLVLGPSRGGIGRHVADLGHELCRRGWDVAATGPASVRDLGFGELPFATAGTASLRRRVAAADVVHAHGLTVGWHAWRACRPCRPCTPLVVTVHNTVSRATHGVRAAGLRPLQQLLPRAADAVIAVSAEVAATLGHRRNVRVVPPFVGWPPDPRPAAEVRRELGVGLEVPLVVVPARLHPQKALPMMVEAAARVRQRIPEAIFLVAGEGPDEAEVRAAVEAHGADGFFRLLGFRHDLNDLMAAADVVALSSVWEGSPLAVQEAMALGRPIVATAVGGLPELVEDGATGRLVVSGDVAGLSDSLAAVLADRGTAEAMGAAGRGRILAMRGADVTVTPVEDIYREVLECV